MATWTRSDVVDDHVGVDLEAAADQLPEKTGMPLQAQEFVGTIDAAPAEVREEFRSMDRVWPNTLASIQYEVVDGSRVWEVGSYAYRPEGLSGSVAVPRPPHADAERSDAPLGALRAIGVALSRSSLQR